VAHAGLQQFVGPEQLQDNQSTGGKKAIAASEGGDRQEGEGAEKEQTAVAEVSPAQMKDFAEENCDGDQEKAPIYQ
jgi:hypothetical protein